MELTNREWKEFSIVEIFDSIQRGKRLKKNDHIGGNIPYTSSTALNNGIDAFIGNDKNVRIFKNCLTLANSGSVGSTFFQPFNVVASDHVTMLDNANFNKYIYLFLATMVTRLNEKYSFNREINDTRIKKEKILLPINSDRKPDYVFMENFMKQKENEFLEKYKKYVTGKESEIKQDFLTDNIEWKEFLFPDIFEIKNGFYNKKPTSSGNGKIPFLGATANKNGVTEYYTLSEIEDNSKIGFGKNEPLSKKLFKGNCIVVTNNGSVGYAYYQVSEFTCSHDVNPLYLKNENLNPYIAKFLITTIEQQRVCFEYARKWRPMRMKKSKILLPVNSENKPDFQYMENYIKTLENEKLKRYLDYKKLNISEYK
ncbi:restriction endonuclease subunit S [Flavobacterium taihuense]|uniref:Restriction endonuclease subunit S n=1 Tax=Flavobacterium taihuense TaxID=2857508 RepID=A0ABS6Y1B3_9FLAO|nr:restriction endonuclease subunit S [Flavobacterium taihuense]MBW4362723.1 restriction endonuclease subunit S [Flavobacterium taihuense]